MFQDEGDLAAYEDELYREESSSDESVDSEVEAYLYSQVHYSQNHSQDDVDEQRKEADLAKKVEAAPTNYLEKKPVIVISDSDDIRVSDSSAVMILSDSVEEDSIYRSKIKGTGSSAVRRPENQSTPKALPREKKASKLQGTKSPRTGKSYKGGIVQEVLVIRGSSDEEDVEVLLTSDSDQSDVENWMLLGRTREDGDASIQLNLKGRRSSASEDNDGVEWSIIEKDSEVTNYTPLRRAGYRYYTEDKNVICRNCNYRGHLSKNCPQPKKLPACCLCGKRGHLQYSCPARYCSNCFMPGHLHQDCTERPYWVKKCHRCSMIGHYADACPDVWRQYHLTVVPGPVRKSNSAAYPKDIVYCCNCGRKGHCGYECSQRRMYSTMYPCCELVCTYDQNHDIRRRNQRAKRKLKELQEAGLVILETEESYIQDTGDNTKPPEKLRKRNKRHAKRQKKAEDSLAIYSSKKSKSGKKKIFHQHEEAEEYFPRGGTEKSKKARRKDEHVLFKSSNKNKKSSDQIHKDKKKRKRMKLKSSAADESLLLIKQRRKKSKSVK